MFTKKVPIKVCPECTGHIFYKDLRHYEVYCSVCGLVLKAPPSADFITPDFKTISMKINVTEDVEVV